MSIPWRLHGVAGQLYFYFLLATYERISRKVGVRTSLKLANNDFRITATLETASEVRPRCQEGNTFFCAMYVTWLTLKETW
jgi:hypothetical protein